MSGSDHARKKETRPSETQSGRRRTRMISSRRRLKRARLLTDKKITVDDVRKWRLENANKEKKTTRKFYNSWVGNKSKD